MSANYTDEKIDEQSAQDSEIEALRREVERLRVLASDKSRWAFIAEASSILGSTLDYDLTLERVAHLAVPEIADWCAVDLADDRLRPGERVAVAHIDPEMVERARRSYRRFPPDPDAEQGLPNVLRSGRSELYPEISAQVLEQAARSAEHHAFLKEVGLKSAMIVPMVARGRTLGAITFVSAREQKRFTNDDLQMAEELARHAALAIDNARLFRETQKAWKTVSIRASQQQAVAAFARHALEVDCQSLFDEALERLIVLLDADAAKLVELTTGHPALVLRAASGWNQTSVGRQFDSDEGTPMGYALRRNEVVIVDDFASSTFHAPPDVEEAAIRSSISLQVPGAKGPFGVLTVLSRAPKTFSSADADLVRGFSNVLSSAIEKERAEQQREHMYERLTDAVRSREELLSIVSHDLRSPAAALKLNLELIAMQIDGQLDDPEPVARSLQKSGENVDRMVALMDDLLGAFRNDAEKMSPTIEEVDFCEVVYAAVSDHEHALLESQTELALDIDGPIIGECDRMRLQQVVSNLLSNAIKYGNGKPVTLSVHLDQDWVDLTVEDHGDGISIEDQEQIFERFRRADDRERVDSYGLGLWIVKRIVDALGGTIDIDSTPGEGTSFCVRLPRSPGS